MNLAAIDIGSNAARLLIAEAGPYTDGTVDFTKLSLLRVPLRLGLDVFADGVISPAREEMTLKTLQAYKLLMDIYHVAGVKACATSAMRDAKNGPQILERIRRETGLSIQILTGQEEASVIYETHIAENLDAAKSYLYIDVGGGSTEVTLFHKNEIHFRESFNIGTIRLMQGQVTDAVWESAKAFIRTAIKPYKQVQAIGSGGNINKVFSLSKRKVGQPLTLDLLRDYHRDLAALSVEERAHRYHLRPDRADVIVPALHIYLTMMRWAGAEAIYVPQIGLADGLVRMLYRELTVDSLTR